MSKAHGYIIIVDPEAPTFEADTLQCCHCGRHWKVVRGSGITRGFCMKCGAVHCGAPGCWECIPYEKRVG